MGWLTCKPSGSACLGRISGLAQRPLTAPGFLRGTGISSQGLRLPKQALSLPSSPSTPGFLWPWRMFPILLFLPSGSHSHSSPALLSEQDAFTSYLFYIVLDSFRGCTPSPFSLKGVLELSLLLSKGKTDFLISSEKTLTFGSRGLLKIPLPPLVLSETRSLSFLVLVVQTFPSCQHLDNRHLPSHTTVLFLWFAFLLGLVRIDLIIQAGLVLII